MAEGARLESVYVGNCIEGSNPSLSAILIVETSSEPGDGSGPTRWSRFEPGQTGNGAALRIRVQARGARALRRARCIRLGGQAGRLRECPT